MFVLTRSGAALRFDLIDSLNIEETEGKHQVVVYELNPEVPIEYILEEFDTFDEAYAYLGDLLERINTVLGKFY